MRYLWNKETQKWDLTEGSYNDPDKGLNGKPWFPDGMNGYYDKALNRHFNTLNEKRQYMRTHGLLVDSSIENKKHRRERIVDQCNADRKRNGQQPMTAKQIFGDNY